MRMGRRIGRPFCCGSYGYLRCCARSDRAATRSCLHYGVGAEPALESAYLAGAKIAEQSPSRIKERDPRKTGLFFANTAIVKSSERRSRSCHVESSRFQTKCSCEASSVNE